MLYNEIAFKVIFFLSFFVNPRKKLLVNPVIILTAIIAIEFIVDSGSVSFIQRGGIMAHIEAGIIGNQTVFRNNGMEKFNIRFIKNSLTKWVITYIAI